MAVTRRPRWPWVLWCTVVASVLAAAATVAAGRLTSPLPEVTVSLDVPATLLVDAVPPPPIPIPARGGFALASSLDGTLSVRDAGVEKPIGSVAKAMTALVVVEAHPLTPGASGPSLTLSAGDVRLYRQAVAEGGSTVPVQAGEILTERDLLLALLLPSANNIAETLAVWVSGNRTAFISRLNAAAKSLGMAHTHFADPSGFSPKTVSTAGDLVLLARAVLANPALAELVSVRQATLPDGTVVNNLDILLGTQPGWIGIKTGWTSAAGGCLLFAARESFSARQGVTVWGAVLGQPPLRSADLAHPELGTAFAAAQRAVIAALARYREVDLGSRLPTVTGSVSTAWGSTTQVAVTGGVSVVAMVRPGAALHLTVTRLTPRAPFGSGTPVARVTGVLTPGMSITWLVVSAEPVPGPSPWWKLLHG